MATYYSGSSNGYTLRVDITEGAKVQSPPSTTVNYSIYLVTTSNSFSGIVNHGYLNLNGVRVWTAPGSYNFTGRYHQTILLGSGSYSVAHNSDGKKTMAIAASFAAPSGGWGPNTISISTSQVLTPITVWTTVKAPTSISVAGATSGERKIKPGTSVKISWSGHASGTSNPIQSYTLQYQSGSGWKNWKTGLTTASYTGAMPSNTRGVYFYFRVIVYGTKNSATSGQSGAYVRNNTLPSAPSVSLNRSGTVAYAVTTVVPTFSGTVYYSRSSGGSKSKATSGSAISLNTGTNNFYFWAWDGLEYSSSATTRTIVREDYTTVKAPTTISVAGSSSSGQYEIKPGTSVTISWTGQASGTNNAIKSYSLQYTSGSGWQNWKTGLTSPSYTGAMPNNTRGAYFYFRVIAVGAKNSATSGQSARYVRNNSLPSAPSVTLNRSGTVPSTVGSVTVTFSVTVYYSTSSGGTKTKINSGATLTLNSGSNTFYFWGWDGLEYSSSATSRTIVRNTKPSLTSYSVAIWGTPPVLDGYNDEDYPFAHDITTSVIPSKKSGTLKFYARKAASTGSLGSASSVHFRSQTVTSTSAHALNSNLLSYLTNPLFGQYVRIGVVFNDGVEDSNTHWQTYGFYLGNAPNYAGFYNGAAADSNVIDSNPNHFYRELRIKHEVNSKVSQYRIAYGSTNSTVIGTVPGTYATGSNYTSVKSIPVGTFTPGTTYYFWLEASYSNGSTTRIGPWPKTQVPNFPFDNPTISNPSNPVVTPIKNPSSATFISFTRKEPVDFSIKDPAVDSSAFKLEFRHSDKSRVIAATATADMDSFDFSATHQMAYPFDLNTATSSGSHNPFNLSFNEVYTNAFFRVTVTNAFGVAYTKDFGPVSLDLRNVLAFHTGSTATSYYSKDGTDWTEVQETTPESPPPILFEREKLRFSYPRAVSHTGTPLKYEIIEVRPQGDVVRATANVNATGTNPSPAEDLHTQTLPRIDATETVTYKVRVTDPKGQQAIQVFTGSITKAQHIPVVATLDQYAFGEEGSSDSVDLTISHLGGGVDGIHLEKVDIDLETSTLSDFLPINEAIVLKADLLQSGTDPIIPDLDGVHTAWTPASNADFGVEVLLFFRLKFTTYPDTTGGLAQPLTSYSPYVVVYNKAPTLSWRENWVGINTKKQGADEVFTISETSTKNLIVLKGLESTITIDLSAGTIEGAEGTVTIDLSTGIIDGTIIDGGSW